MEGVEFYLSEFVEANDVESDGSGCRYAQHRHSYLHCLIHVCGWCIVYTRPDSLRVCYLFLFFLNAKSMPASSISSLVLSGQDKARGVGRKEEDKVSHQ